MSSAQAGTGTSATLRPRNKRLISLEGDDSPRNRSLSPIAAFHGEDESITSSRAPSPIPSAHPSRATASIPRSTPDRFSSAPSSRTIRAPPWSSKNTFLSSGYWGTSWSSIQGVASTLLGNNIPEHQRAQRRKQSISHGSKYSFGTSFDEWGPKNAERDIAAGSQEDRLAQLQAKKREALLLANGYTDADSTGRFKRRMSTDHAALSPTDDFADTPVYLHQVQVSDTLAGLSIRYNCSQATIRRANRLYPNDTIQVRNKAYIPVDACAVKGRKVSSTAFTKPPPAIDLLGDGAGGDGTPSASTPSASNGPSEFASSGPKAETSDWSITSSPPPMTPKQPFQIAASPPLSIPTSNSQTTFTEPPYTHDSWVTIDHIAEPVEIVRLPRRALGFFPPARRKSINYTDTTPPASPMLPAHPSTDTSVTNSPNRSGSRDQHQQPPAVSLFNAPRTSQPHSTPRPSDYFMNAFSGPGGVGSLSRTASPGPAMDRLNTFVNTHLPAAAAKAAAAAGVQLPVRLTPSTAGQTNSRPPTLGTGLGGGLSAARSSFESVTSAGSEFAGRVEGWVRKTGQKSPMGVPSEPDLIEMVEGAEGTADDSRKKAGSGTALEIEEERLLRERFPARGRVFEEQPRSRAKAKQGS